MNVNAIIKYNINFNAEIVHVHLLMCEIECNLSRVLPFNTLKFTNNENVSQPWRKILKETFYIKSLISRKICTVI